MKATDGLEGEWPMSREARAARLVTKESSDGHDDRSMARMVDWCLDVATLVLGSWRELRDLESV